MPKLDTSTLQAALIGYQEELGKIDAAMAAIRRQIGGKVTHQGASGPIHKGRMSVAGRKSIAAAQKKRWAVFHAKQKASARTASTKTTTKKVAPRRKFSPARKAAMAANLAKARAAKAAKKEARVE